MEGHQLSSLSDLPGASFVLFAPWGGIRHLSFEAKAGAHRNSHTGWGFLPRARKAKRVVGREEPANSSEDAPQVNRSIFGT